MLTGTHGAQIFSLLFKNAKMGINGIKCLPGSNGVCGVSQQRRARHHRRKEEAKDCVSSFLKSSIICLLAVCRHVNNNKRSHWAGHLRTNSTPSTHIG